MKYFKFYILVFCLCLCTFKIFAQPLNGTYTIGSTGNYLNFNSAVSDLIAKGVNGAVIFNVQNGTYVEQISIPAIGGSSNTNTITFIAASALLAELKYNSTNPAANYVVEFNGCSNISFKNLKVTNYSTTVNVGAVFNFRTNLATVSNILLEGNTITGRDVVDRFDTYILIYGESLGLSFGCLNVMIKNNTLLNGSEGIYFEGRSNANRNSNIVIENNVLTNFLQTGIDIYLSNTNLIKGNTITNKNLDVDAYGIYVQNSNFTDIIANKVFIYSPTVTSGIEWWTSNGSVGTRMKVINNFVASLSGTGACHGIEGNTSSYNDIFHNTVLVKTGNANSAALFFDATGFTSNNIQNNILINRSIGRALQLVLASAPEINSCNDNVLFTSGSNICRLGTNATGTNYFTKADWTLATTRDVNSIASNCRFVSDTDLHLKPCQLYLKTTNIAPVPSDIDNQARSANPYRGADEYSCSPLVGSYTIGATGDFLTFTEAVDELTTCGIGGAVTFTVQNGTYNEQISIPVISGASATNTITFIGESKAGVILQKNPTSNNWIVNLQGTDHIRFTNFTISNTSTTPFIGRVFYLNNSQFTDIKIENCVLNGRNVDDANIGYTIFACLSNGNDVSDILINNCEFNYGSRAIQLDAVTTNVAVNCEFSNNKIYNFYDIGITANFHTGLIINNNEIFGKGTGSSEDGINCFELGNNCKITENKVNLFSTGSNLGIAIFTSIATSANELLIANNMISNQYALTSSNGIYLDAGNYVWVYHNTVKINDGISTSSAIYINSTVATNHRIANNIFVNSNGGFAINIANNTHIDFCNYNNLYTSGLNLGKSNGTNRANLTAWQTATTFDANSLNENPTFISNADLHINTIIPTNIESNGTPIAGITTDYDGNIRNLTTPDIGADEEDFTAFCSPISGTYTIGATGDFLTFTDAVDALVNCGISAPVIFTVQNGTYNEQITIPQITGTSSTNTITFIAENPQIPVLEFDASTTPAQIYVVKLDGADYITFKNLKITNTSTDTDYGRVFDLITPSSSITNIVFDGNIITTALGNAIGNYCGIRFYGSTATNNVDNITIQNNIFNGGESSLFWEGASGAVGNGNIILNNQFKDYYLYGVNCQYQNDLLIQRNIFKGQGIANSEGAIYLLECYDNTRILSNKIECKPVIGGEGIYIDYCYGALGNEIEISNNMINITTGIWNNGIYLASSEYIDVINNTINVKSDPIWYSCLYVDAASLYINIFNNILVNTQDGYALYFEDIAAITDCDFNILYSSLGKLGNSDGVNYNTFADWKTNTGFDLNSYNENPPFISASDLHINTTIPTNIESNGTPLGLTTDIDGNTRNAITPDIGADEGDFTPMPSPLCGTYSIGDITADFPAGLNFDSFTDAVNALTTYGIGCNVIFSVKNGTYNEQILIPYYSGSETFTTTFIAQNSLVPIISNAATATNNYVVSFSGAKNVIFRNLKITNTDVATANVGTVIKFIGGASNITIDNCDLTGKDIILVPPSYNYAVVYAGTSLKNNIIVQNCDILKGSYGIYYDGPAGRSTNCSILTNNITLFQHKGIELYRQTGMTVSNNIITGKGTFTIEHGISLDDVTNTDVFNNRVQVAGNDQTVGIVLNSCNASFGNENNIYNNFVVVLNGSISAFGICYNISSFANIYYNSVNIAGTSAITSGALYLNLSIASSTNIKNNIFANNVGGVAISSISGVLTYFNSDYNDLFTTGANLCKANVIDYTNLLAWTIATTPNDANSISANPNYISNTDLHINTGLVSFLESSGTTILGITNDIDGIVRNLTTPDIGADEGNFLLNYTPQNLKTTSAFGKIYLDWTQTTMPNFLKYNIC